MEDNKTEAKKRNRKELIEWIKTIFWAVLIAFIVMQFFVPTVVKEHSMEPNFYGDDYLIISKKAYTFGEAKRGDVIVFESNIPIDANDASKGDKLLIKRIVGLPGDRIDIHDGEVYINNEKTQEKYIKEGYTPGEIIGYQVPKDSFFCMGDNRAVSVDSRDYRVGPIKESAVLGKAILRLYPFDSIKIIKNENPLEKK